MKDLETLRKDLRVEQDELNGKISRLVDFLSCAPDVAHVGLLYEQLHHMKEYALTLQKRIDAVSYDIEQANQKSVARDYRRILNTVRTGDYILERYKKGDYLFTDRGIDEVEKENRELKERLRKLQKEKENERISHYIERIERGLPASYFTL